MAKNAEGHQTDRQAAVNTFFIAGVQRSGTTLLSVMLRKHPAIYIEERSLAFRLITASKRLQAVLAYNLSVDRPALWSWIIRNDFEGRLASVLDHQQPDQYKSWQELIQASIDRKLKDKGQQLWGDKAPNLQHYLPDLRLLLPHARIIHIVRDGRATAYSLSRRSRRSLMLSAQQWTDGNVLAYSNRDLIGADNYLILRYEDLLRQPEDTMRKVCDFLSVEFSAAVLDPTDEEVPEGQRYVKNRLDTSKIDAYRQQLSDQQIRRIERIQGPLLREFGYPLPEGYDLAASYKPLSPLQRLALSQADNFYHLFQTRRIGMEQRQIVQKSIPISKRLYSFLRRLGKDLFSDQIFKALFKRIRHDEKYYRSDADK